jgi:apolipoprotein D and lipocalin family protein
MKNIVFLLLFLALAGCQTAPPKAPLQPVAKVDLPRFMGDWYVIAHIPTFLEKGAYNAVESYRLRSDGTIVTTFTFNQDAPDGPKKTYQPKGFVRNTRSNAEWGMQFVWPLQADYVIVYLDQQYQQTIIAREQRDYVWIMSRTPRVTPAEYDALTERVRAMGYDLTLLRRVPQQTQPSTGNPP